MDLLQHHLLPITCSLLTMLYPVVVHKDQTSDYGVSVPDLPGCFSAGRTLDEALENIKEAIECQNFNSLSGKDLLSASQLLGF